ncbi:hypothetical protein [Flavobacterium sp.]|mgnify:CR=1 FL=1|uniref:hypothetical protein n=1 Tax=Flavobacterium sp. TaxID=239 RepID=UPI002FDEA6B7
MENNTTAIENLIEKAESYYKTTLELYKYKAISKLADIFSDLAVNLILIIVVVLFLLFLEIGLALYLGEYFVKVYYGFFAIAIINVFIGWLILALRGKWIKTSVSNAIIKKTKVLDS